MHGSMYNKHVDVELATKPKQCVENDDPRLFSSMVIFVQTENKTIQCRNIILAAAPSTFILR